jgi:hypothetical protein
MTTSPFINSWQIIPLLLAKDSSYEFLAESLTLLASMIEADSQILLMTSSQRMLRKGAI